MRAGWMAASRAVLAGIVLAACGGSSGGAAPPGQPAIDGSAGTIGDGGDGGGGAGGDATLPGSGDEGDPGDPGGDGACGENWYCFDYCVDKEVSYALVSVPCRELVTGITATDPDDPEMNLIGTFHEWEPSADGCSDPLAGYKIEDLHTSSVRICVRTSEPIDPNAVTIQLKYGTTCEVVNGSTDRCSASAVE